MSPDEVKQQILKWDKDAKEIEIITSGAINIVGLTKAFVYRFPATDDGLTVQLFEAELYKRLNNKLAVPTPQFVRIYKEPECIVLTRLEGRSLSIEELAGLPTEDLRQIIQQLLQFSVSLNAAVTPEAIKELERTCIPEQLHDRPWRDYFSLHLEKAHIPEQPWLEDLAHKQYAKWSHLVNTTSLPQIVVHDDLNEQNMLFINNKISGILDFGDTTVGSIAQELRQLLRISEEAVQIAIDEYAAATGIVIDFEEIATWAINQELAAYCKWFSKDELTRPSFLRAQANLRQWLGDFEW